VIELYQKQIPCLVALDSIIFGFDGNELKLLLVKRGLEDDPNTWSLMGGWLKENESLDEAAKRIVFELTGLDDVYLEQLATFGKPQRDPVKRTVSVTYKALINISDYQEKISNTYTTNWFSLTELPNLLFDHKEMINFAIDRLRSNAALNPIGFELLPNKFTIPQLQKLYEAIFSLKFDKRNFSRRILSTGYLMKTNEKQKGHSKKGAFFYELDKSKENLSSDIQQLFISNVKKIL
jgi:ADP-ribose pyrophosphatase YjhB (NUDIX family)